MAGIRSTNRSRVKLSRFKFTRLTEQRSSDGQKKGKCRVHEAGQPTGALTEVVGDKPIPRTEVTKRLWVYIKKNKLQDAKNKRMIKADDTLKSVFGGKATVNMFEMTKLVGKHLK